MPVGVGRVVDLPRAPTDREWEILVSDLRATFGAKGKVESHGAQRAWTNSRLHAYVEPTDTGYRLRLGTEKGNAYVAEAMGVGAVVLSAVMFVTQAAGDPGDAILMLTMGVGALVANRFRLPPWARRREEQMEHVARRALELTTGPEDTTA
jgi:hypothetical protein